MLYNADNSQTKRLVGYYTTKEGVTESGLLDYLRERLPLGMAPYRLVQLQSLPMTINGKLNINALPTAQPSYIQYSPPRSPTEQRLCRLWASLLPISSSNQAIIGIDHNFFHCGGDSVLAMQLASKMQRELNYKINVKNIFDYPSIRSLVDNTRPSNSLPVELDSLTGSCPLLPIQNWFFSKPLTNKNHWNQFFAIRVPTTDVELLRVHVDKLVQHHDVFKLRFKETQSGVMQFYSDTPLTVPFYHLNVKGLDVEHIQDHVEEWQRKFDIQNGPTACVAYLEGFENGTARMWIAMHHLIVDTVSWQVISQDLHTLFHGGELGSRSTSYRQWAERIRQYSISPSEELHWKEMVQGANQFGLISSSKYFYCFYLFYLF